MIVGMRHSAAAIADVRVTTANVILAWVCGTSCAACPGSWRRTIVDDFSGTEWVLAIVASTAVVLTSLVSVGPVPRRRAFTVTRSESVLAAESWANPLTRGSPALD